MTYKQTEEIQEDNANESDIGALSDLITPIHANINSTAHIYDSIEGILVEEEPQEDILTTVQRLLKQASYVTSQVTLKEIMLLTAVTGYVQLYQTQQLAPGQKLTKPAQATSLAVAHRMGKGPAFAQKIQEMVHYIT